MVCSTEKENSITIEVPHISASSRMTSYTAKGLLSTKTATGMSVPGRKTKGQAKGQSIKEVRCIGDIGNEMRDMVQEF